MTGATVPAALNDFIQCGVHTLYLDCRDEKIALNSQPRDAFMILDRPYSHIAAMLFFSMIAIAGLSTLDSDGSTISAQFALAIFYLLAAIILIFPSRWAQLYCSLTLLWPVGFLALQVGIILYATSAPIFQAVPWIVMTGLMYWLFHAYAFGKASKTFYAKQDPLPSIKSLFQRKRSRRQNA